MSASEKSSALGGPPPSETPVAGVVAGQTAQGQGLVTPAPGKGTAGEGQLPLATSVPPTVAVAIPSPIPTATPTIAPLPTATAMPVPTPTPVLVVIPTATPEPTPVPTPMYHKGTDEYGLEIYEYPLEEAKLAFQQAIHAAMTDVGGHYPPIHDATMDASAQEYAQAIADYREWPNLTVFNPPVYSDWCDADYIWINYEFSPDGWEPVVDDVDTAVKGFLDGSPNGTQLAFVMEMGWRRYGVGVGGPETIYEGDTVRVIYSFYHCVPKFTDEELQAAVDDVLDIERAEYRLPDRITLFHGANCITNILGKTNPADPGVNDIRDSDGRTQFLFFAAQVDGGGIQNCTNKLGVLLSAYGAQGHELSDDLGRPLQFRDAWVQDYPGRLDDAMFGSVKREGLIDLAYTDDAGKTACDHVLEGIAAEIAHALEWQVEDGRDPDPLWYDGLQVTGIPWICDAIGQDAVIVDADGNELGTVDYDPDFDHFLAGVVNLH